MASLVTFKTSRFDPTKEPRNPINPIQGVSALHWLRDEVFPEDFTATEPDAEDWGWYIDVVGPDANYLVGSMVELEEGDYSSIELEWMIQIEKKRSLMEKLTGKNKMTTADRLQSLIVDALRSDTSFSDVLVEEDA